MRTRNRRLIALFAALAILIPAASVLGDSTPDSYTLPGERVFPEGVAVLPGPDYFYVSSTEDGTIFRGQLQQPEAEVFLAPGQDGRNTAVGLAVDTERHTLFISGGNSGSVWAYDLRTRALLAHFSNDYDTTFINDVTVTPDGAAYFTDSMQPVIYRLTGAATGDPAFEEWLDLDGTAIEYQEGFNLNGIVSTPDGSYLIVVHSPTGTLYRIATEDGAVEPVDLNGANVQAGDGLVLRGGTLNVVQNAFGQITTLRMSADLLSGEVWSVYASSEFRTPTTAAILGGRMLVVNAQFSARQGTPVLPFTVSSIPIWEFTRTGIQ